MSTGCREMVPGGARCSKEADGLYCPTHTRERELYAERAADGFRNT